MFNAESVMAFATCLIAAATFWNVKVYRTISKQIDSQVGLAKEQIKLTRDLFLEAHAPALSVSFDKCAYSKADGRFDGVIVIKNHGTVAANDIDLRIQFGGTNYVRSVSRVAIQPNNRLTYPFALNVSANKYDNSQTQGNRLNSYVYGSYEGLAGTKYKYNERAEFYSEFRRFVPFWSE